MSKRDENTSDDEFHDAISTGTKNHEDFDKATTKANNYKLSDDSEEEPVYHEPDASSDDENYDVDEEGLKQEEEFLTEEEKLRNKEESEKQKVEGNELFKNQKYEQSVEAYTKALILCPLVYKKDRAVFYANRAAAKIQLNSNESAIEDCNKAIELNPDYVRALLRRAKLLESTNKFNEAFTDFKKIKELDPSNRDANEALIRLPPLINEQNEKLKAEMMVQLKGLGNMILKPFGLSTDNFQVKQDPSTGSYSINMQNNS